VASHQHELLQVSRELLTGQSYPGWRARRRLPPEGQVNGRSSLLLVRLTN
jgi:hypothetical protein